MNQNFKHELEGIASALEKEARQAGVIAENVVMQSTVTPDEPIRTAAEDRLNRSGFAAELAKAISNFDRSESVVVGIHGKWGTGKTSLLNLVAEKLQEVSSEAPIIFRFNPWGFSDQDQLTIRFFGELAAFLRLHMSIPSLSGVSDTVEEYGELLSPIARLFFPTATQIAGVGWKWFRKIKPKQPKTPTELKARINAVLREAHIKLIIMVDDIDRLNAIEIRQMFQLIKLNANFANTVYVVAFDKRPIERALRSVSPGPANEYLQKIVQVSFSLPPISEVTLTELILNAFNETIVRFQINTMDQQRFGNMFHSGFRTSFRTIRDVNRYFNLFRFALNLMQKDVDFIDLAAVEALALFYPSIYQSIERNPDLFCGGWSDIERRDKEQIEAKYKKVFSKLHAGRLENAMSICTFLFPKLEWVYGPSKMIYGSGSEQSWQKAKRIAAPKFFPYYFQLAVPDTDFSQSEMDRAIAKTNSVSEFVQVLSGCKHSKRLSTFIDSLRNQLNALSEEQLLVIMKSIFVFGDEVDTEGTPVFGVISEYIRFAVWLLLDVLDSLPSDRFQKLCDAMRGQPAVFTISDTSAMFERVISGNTDSIRLRERYPDLNDEAVSQMKAISIDVIRKTAMENRLLDISHLGAVLYRWQEWGNRTEVSEWISSNVLADPKRAATFVASFARTVTSMSITDKVPRTRITISVRDIEKLVDLNQLAELLRETKDGELTEKQRTAKARFLTAKSLLDSGKDPDSRFPFDDE